MSNVKKSAAKLESPVGHRINLQKVCFSGGTSLTWSMHKPKFFAELKTKHAQEFVDLTLPGALAADGSPVELVLGTVRPCPVGEEEAHVQAIIDQQVASVNANLATNVALLNAIPANQMNAGAKAVEITKLQIKTNDEIVKINNTRNSIMKDLEASILQFEKREETFQQRLADCIKTFYNMLGAGPLSIAEPHLRLARPRAAFHALDTHYNAGVGGQEAASNIMSQMQSFPIDLSSATLSEHISMMEALAIEYEGGGINHPLASSFIMHCFMQALGTSPVFEDVVKFIKDHNLTWEAAKLKLQEKEANLLVQNGLAKAKKQHHGGGRDGSLSKEIHSLICKEIRRVAKRPLETETAAAAGASPQKKSVPTCTKCKKRGHSAEQCWSEIVCSTCGVKGHIPKFCPTVTGKPLGASPKKLIKVRTLQ